MLLAFLGVSHESGIDVEDGGGQGGNERELVRVEDG